MGRSDGRSEGAKGEWGMCLDTLAIAGLMPTTYNHRGWLFDVIRKKCAEV